MIGQCCVAFEHIKASMAILTLRIHVTTTCRLYSCVFDCFGSSTTEWDYYERDVFRSQTVSTSPENSLNYIWLAKWLYLIQPQIVLHYITDTLKHKEWRYMQTRYHTVIDIHICYTATVYAFHIKVSSSIATYKYSYIPLF